MKRNRALSLLAALVLLMTALPISAMAETAVVKDGWLRLRSAPTTESTHIKSYFTGTVVTILGTSGAWTHVRTPDGNTGYMLSEFLVKGSQPTAAPKQATGVTRYVTSANGRSVNLRRGAGYGYGVIWQYPVGTKVTVTGTSGEWSSVSIPGDGRTGWMLSSCLSEVQMSAPTGKVENTTMYITSKNGRSVNLRAQASTTARVIAAYAVNTKVTVLNRGATWSYISVGNQLGYMMTQFLTTTKPARVTNPTTTTVTPAKNATDNYVAYVKSGNARPINFRSGPGTKYAIIGSAPTGTQLTVVKKGNIWSFIRIGTVYGYMMTQFITTKKP